MDSYGPCQWRPEQPPKSRPEQIVEAVCALMRVSMDDLRSRGRRQHLSEARQIVMYALRELTAMSSPEVGRMFDRDHSTVIHAYQRIKRRLDDSPQWGDMLRRVLAQVDPEWTPERHQCTRCGQRAA